MNRHSRHFAIVAGATLLALAGCENPPSKEKMGTVGGAVVGGVVVGGAVVGGAVGNDVGDQGITTAVGAAVGAVIGRKVQEEIQDNRAEKRTVTTTERRCAPVGSR